MCVPAPERMFVTIITKLFEAFFAAIFSKINFQTDHKQNDTVERLISVCEEQQRVIARLTELCASMAQQQRQPQLVLTERCR